MDPDDARPGDGAAPDDHGAGPADGLGAAGTPVDVDGPESADGSGTWRPDVLGAGWRSRTIRLRPDVQGPAVATLVRWAPGSGAGGTPAGGTATPSSTTTDGRTDSGTGPGRPPRRPAVLYVHGYIDYFFQAHLGQVWAAWGYDFYALDLRAHGRSLLPHQIPNYTTELAVHAEELGAALRIIRGAGHDVVVGHGHSTGGLVMSLWAHALRGRPDRPALDALVLNSPWLELNRGWFHCVVTTAVVDVLGRAFPRTVIGHLHHHYGRHIHHDTGGEWEYDLSWKPHGGFGIRAGWLRTVRRAHRTLQRGLAVDVPVLVCAAERSGPGHRAHDALGSTDSVLSVEDIVALAPQIGRDVTVVQITGGIHDLALSAEPARSAYFAAIHDWLARRSLLPEATGPGREETG